MKKIALIGCGARGRLHAGKLSARARLCFYSRSRHRAENFQRRFGGEGVCNSFEEVLEMDEVAAVLIASPPNLHCRQVVAALRAGKSVLVEKPLCVTREEMAAIGAQVERCEDSFLMVAENYCYKPSLALMKEWIAAGFVGEVRSVRVRKQFTQEASGWKSRWGALLEGGIHFVALISALFEAAPQKVAAQFPGWSPGAAERSSIVRLEYARGAVAELRYAWNAPSWSRGLLQHSHIAGERGEITFESNGLYVRLKGETRKRLRFPLGDLMGYDRMIQDFLACMEDRSRTPGADFYKAQRDLQIVFDAYGAGGIV